MKNNKRPGLPEAQWAALRLLLLPECKEALTDDERAFLRSVVDGKWPEVFAWLIDQKGFLWTTKAPTKPQ